MDIFGNTHIIIADDDKDIIDIIQMYMEPIFTLPNVVVHISNCGQEAVDLYCKLRNSQPGIKPDILITDWDMAISGIDLLKNPVIRSDNYMQKLLLTAREPKAEDNERVYKPLAVPCLNKLNFYTWQEHITGMYKNCVTPQLAVS